MSEEIAYKDPEFLEMAYWKRNQTIGEIAELFGVCEQTIYYWMERHEIPRRDKAGPGPVVHRHRAKRSNPSSS
jgi:predicted DNA-binding transcriptional regulator AlpA